VTWRSKKQNVVSRSSAEAKYRGMAHTACEMMWLKIDGGTCFFFDTSPMLIHCDNQAVIYIVNNLVFHERTKHIEVNCHFVWECVMTKMICTWFTPSEQLVDIFTKAISSKGFMILCDKLGMIDISSLRGSSRL